MSANNGYLSNTEEKKASFLPRLDNAHRYSNSQVQYRELNEINKTEIKDRVDMSIKSPSNNWVNDSLVVSAKKNSFSQERKNPII